MRFPLSGRLTWMAGFACLLALIGLGCQGISSPSFSGGSSSALSGPGSAASPYGGNAILLTEVPGSVPAGGRAIYNAVQTGKPGTNTFVATINVTGGPPDTDLYLQLVGDVLPATRGDGVCNPASFPNPPRGLRILHTSPDGAGAVNGVSVVPEGAFFGAFEPGVKTDFKYRLVNLAQTFDLRSDCIVLTGK